MSRIVALAAVSLSSRVFISKEQSFSIYIPYADMTIFCIDSSGQLGAAISIHWACTALYSGSPVRLIMFAPPVKSLAAHI